MPPALAAAAAAAALATLAVAPARTAIAAPTAREPWLLEGVRAAYCIRFLVRPNILPYIVPEGVVPLTADRAPALDPVLRYAVAERPDSFGSFAPGRLCTVHFDAARVGGERITADEHSSLSFVVWTVTAAGGTVAGTGAAGVEGAREAAIGVRSNDGDLVDALRDAGLRAGKVWTRLGVLSDTAREESTIRLGGTRVVWEGRLGAAPDGADRSASWEAWVPGEGRGAGGTLRIELEPAAVHSMVGSLTVTGEDDFSESLAASPVRFAGPVYLGGTARVTITR